MFRILRCLPERAQPATWKCDVGAQRQNLIFNREPTGKLEKKPEFWILRVQSRLPVRDLQSTRAGGRGWSARSQISFWTFTRASTDIRRFCLLSWLIPLL